MTMPMEDFLAANRANWNDRVPIHAADENGFYGIERLLAGAVLLTPIERGELGSVEGLRIAHFQCHIGTDTLSLKRLGAGEVVGLDFSEAAVEEARLLASRTGLDARFVLGSVFDAPSLLGGDFDLVFTTWGTLCWLPDLHAWAKAVAGVLRPGGRLYFADSHPGMTLFEDDGAGNIVPRYDPDTPVDRPLRFEQAWTYTGSRQKLDHAVTYEWLHSVSSILNALIAAGMVIERVSEHDRLPWAMFGNFEHKGEGLFGLPDAHPRLPVAWSVQARKG